MCIEPVRQRPLLTLWISAMVLIVGAAAVGAAQSDSSQDQKYSGIWIGSYTVSDGAEGSLTFSFRKEEKGEWRGTVKFTNQDGEHTLELKPLQIAAGKLKAKADLEGAEIAIEGELREDRLEGKYSVKPTGATEIAETGSWKVAKESAAKPER